MTFILRWHMNTSVLFPILTPFLAEKIPWFSCSSANISIPTVKCFHMVEHFSWFVRNELVILVSFKQVFSSFIWAGVELLCTCVLCEIVSLEDLDYIEETLVYEDLSLLFSLLKQSILRRAIIILYHHRQMLPRSSIFTGCRNKCWSLSNNCPSEASSVEQARTKAMWSTLKISVTWSCWVHLMNSILHNCHGVYSRGNWTNHRPLALSPHSKAISQRQLPLTKGFGQCRYSCYRQT